MCGLILLGGMILVYWIIYAILDPWKTGWRYEVDRKNRKDRKRGA